MEQLLMLFGFALISAAIGLWIWTRAQENRVAAGLPKGRVIHSDGGSWHPQMEPLTAPQLQLVGRPDYLVEQANGAIVPVEIKSQPAPPEPYDGHVMQLAAYCFLVEENFGTRPPHGIIQYSDIAYSVEYTPLLEEQLLDVIAEMRVDMIEEEVERDHDEAAVCASCGVRAYCADRLV